jgi:hypothetical protein
MIGSIVMIRGGNVGIVTSISEGWLVINDDINTVTLPSDVVEITPGEDPDVLKWLGRQMGADPLTAHRIPQIVKDYEHKLGRIAKMDAAAQAHEPLKELEALRKELAQSRAKFESEKKELDHQMSVLMLAQAKHNDCIKEKDAEIATLKEKLHDLQTGADKKHFSDLSYEKDQHAITRAKLAAVEARLQAIKAEADRPKKLVWQVKYGLALSPEKFAELLNDGWEVMWQDAKFDTERHYIVNANFKRLYELPADPAPDPDAAIAAAEAHLDTIPLPDLEPEPLEQPEPEVVYHISGEQKPTIKLGKYGEHIRKHGAADALDILNAQIGANVSAAMAQALEDPVIQRMLNPQPLLSAQSTPVQ